MRHSLPATDLYYDMQSTFDLNASHYLEDDEHWGNDSDFVVRHGHTLRRALGHPIDLLYAGVGPGRILVSLFEQPTFFRELVGIDYSPRMLDLASKELAQADTIDGISLLSRDLLRDDLAPMRYDMVLCMNNTLGNLIWGSGPNIPLCGERGRRRAVQRIAATLRPGGCVCLTVYSFWMAPAASSNYTARLQIVSKPTAQDFILQFTHAQTAYRFYSHWFTLDELESLLSENGLRLFDYEERDVRILACAQKS